MKISAEMTFVPRPQINSIETAGWKISAPERERERESLFGDTAGFAEVVENDYANVERIRIPTDYRRPWRRENGAVSFHLARRCVEISGNNELPHPVIAPRNRNPIRCFWGREIATRFPARLKCINYSLTATSRVFANLFSG